MPPRFELTFKTTREDWIAVNEMLIASGPHWTKAAAKYKRTALRQVLWSSPLIVGFASLGIGTRSSTSGMYVEGALIGLVFCVFLAFALPRIDYIGKAKEEQSEQIRRMDLSDHIGIVNVVADAQGVFIKTPARELKLSWTTVAPHDMKDFILLAHGGSDGTVIPKHAFAAPADAAAFLEQTLAWWREGQLPPTERIARYLADRNVACPGCAYNLRGIRQDRCPECGLALTLETLHQAKQ